MNVVDISATFDIDKLNITLHAQSEVVQNGTSKKLTASSYGKAIIMRRKTHTKTQKKLLKHVSVRRARSPWVVIFILDTFSGQINLDLILWCVCAVFNICARWERNQHVYIPLYIAFEVQTASVQWIENQIHMRPMQCLAFIYKNDRNHILFPRLC